MSSASSLVAALPLFQNERLLSFDHPENAAAMREGLQTVRSQLGREYPMMVAGRPFRTRPSLVSTNPARPSQIVGVHHEAEPEAADLAVSAALAAFETWRFVPAQDRAELLLKAAAAIRSRKYEFSAWLVYEVGKNWGEADAETAEAIDFLEFYAREALRLDGVQPPARIEGENNEFFYIPLGVGAVISPWNFPLAITAGMTAAAIVCGNTVVLKPSSDAPTIANVFCSLLEECGIPPGVVNLCQGGPEFGKALVEHPKTRFIAFTGSKAVGLDINTRAAQPRDGQIWIKRTILEMGGKDSIIVDKDANLDDAAAGVFAAAFGFSGQKCSACSRVIVDESIHDAFLSKLLALVPALKHGDPAENCSLGPLVNRKAYDRVLRYIDVGQREGRLVYGGKALTAPEQGYFVSPTIITEVAPDATISQEEIFGPVLAVLRARDFSDALGIANNTEYGLTGSVYTTSPTKMREARRRFHVGNLYFNRKSTGALVGVHPFGGFNMSGTDSKAGGADYLYLFSQGKSVSEKR